MSEIEKFDDKDKFLDTFANLRPDLFYPEAWSESDRAEANAVLKKNRTKTNMYGSIPMRCEGSRCIMADTCPLLAINRAPVGKPCPIEMAMVVDFAEGYVKELRVDEGSMVEMGIVRELVDQEIQYIRKSKVLAKEDFIQENPVGVDADGNVILKKELHQAVEYEDRILKRKRELLKLMTATRSEKAKIGQGNIDTAMAISSAMSQLAEVHATQEKLIRAKLGTAERDDYIDAVEAEIIDNEA